MIEHHKSIIGHCKKRDFFKIRILKYVITFIEALTSENKTLHVNSTFLPRNYPTLNIVLSTCTPLKPTRAKLIWEWPVIIIVKVMSSHSLLIRQHFHRPADPLKSNNPIKLRVYFHDYLWDPSFLRYKKLYDRWCIKLLVTCKFRIKLSQLHSLEVHW